MKNMILAMVVLVASASAAAAQTVFVVRHAERADGYGTQGAHGAPAKERSGAQGSPRATEPGSGAEPRQDMMKNDPGLSDAGRARAESLAATLKDAGVTAIFVTEFRRTRETAAPLAKLLGVEPQAMPSRDTPALIARLKSARGHVLVVGHSNTVPEIVKGLGVSTAVTVGDADYDNLLVVTLGDRPSLLRLHYR
jgi:hypothetical protein